MTNINKKNKTKKHYKTILDIFDVKLVHKKKKEKKMIKLSII